MIAFLAMGMSIGCPVVISADGGKANAASVEIVQVRVGLDARSETGLFKVGFWTPVWVSVRGLDAGSDCEIDLIAPDGEDTPARFVRQPMGGVDSSGGDPSLPAEGRPVERETTASVMAARRTAAQVTISDDGVRTFLRYAKIGRGTGSLAIEVRVAGQMVARRESPLRAFAEPVSSTKRVLLKLGPDIGVADSMRHLTMAETESFVVVDGSNLPSLPEHWFGYEGIDVIVMTTESDPGRWRYTPRQVEAMATWVRMGGRLIWAAGASAPQFAAAGKPLAVFAPGEVTETVPLRRPAGIETFAGGSDRLELGTVEEQLPRLAVLDAYRGVPLLFEGSGNAGEQPLAIRSSLGFGQVVFIAIDLTHASFSKWRGKGRLLARILQPATIYLNENYEWRNPIGYSDMSGQLRTALDQHSGVTLVAFSWISILIVGYLLLIGPLDYLLLRKLGRSHWTWVTFPCVALALSAFVFVLNGRVRHSEVRLNQVDLVDVDVNSGLVRGTTWIQSYSPKTEGYDLQLRPDVWSGAEPRDAMLGSGSEQMLLSWQGLSGDGLRGLDATSRAPIFTQPYEIAIDYEHSSSHTAGMPMLMGASGSLIGRWWREVPVAGESRLVADTKSDRLSGEVCNPFPVPLHEATIYYGGNLYVIDRSLAPGEAFRLDGRYPKNLEWRLTQRRVTSDSREVTVPWDPASQDVPRILELMMFHGSAGGRNYTRLLHHYQAYVDLSDQLKMQRAVLVGRLDGRAATLQRDGDAMDSHYDRTWTVGRAVLPVVVERRSGT